MECNQDLKPAHTVQRTIFELVRSAARKLEEGKDTQNILSVASASGAFSEKEPGHSANDLHPSRLTDETLAEWSTPGEPIALPLLNAVRNEDPRSYILVILPSSSNSPKGTTILTVPWAISTPKARTPPNPNLSAISRPTLWRNPAIPPRASKLHPPKNDHNASSQSGYQLPNAHGGGDGTHMPALEVEQMLDYGPLSCKNKPFNVEPLSDDFVR